MDRHPKRRAQLSFRKNEEGKSEEPGSKPSKRILGDGARRPGRPPKIPKIDELQVNVVQEQPDISSQGKEDSKVREVSVIFKAEPGNKVVPVSPSSQDTEEERGIKVVEFDENQNVVFLPVTVLTNTSEELQPFREESIASAISEEDQQSNDGLKITEVFSVPTQFVQQDQPQMAHLPAQMLQSNDFQLQYTFDGPEPIKLSRVPYPPPGMDLSTDTSVRIDTSGVNLTQSPSAAGNLDKLSNVFNVLLGCVGLSCSAPAP